MTAKSRKATEALNTTDSLNRATLRLTFNTLRKTTPSSALLIQNLLMQRHSTSTKSDADIFLIELSDEQVEHIIQGLLALCLITSQQQYPTMNMHTLRGLLNQWTKVANYRKLF